MVIIDWKALRYTFQIKIVNYLFYFFRRIQIFIPIHFFIMLFDFFFLYLIRRSSAFVTRSEKIFFCDVLQRNFRWYNDRGTALRVWSKIHERKNFILRPSKNFDDDFGYCHSLDDVLHGRLVYGSHSRRTCTDIGICGGVSRKLRHLCFHIFIRLHFPVSEIWAGQV